MMDSFIEKMRNPELWFANSRVSGHLISDLCECLQYMPEDMWEEALSILQSKIQATGIARKVLVLRLDPAVLPVHSIIRGCRLAHLKDTDLFTALTFTIDRDFQPLNDYDKSCLQNSFSVHRVCCYLQMPNNFAVITGSKTLKEILDTSPIESQVGLRAIQKSPHLYRKSLLRVFESYCLETWGLGFL